MFKRFVQGWGLKHSVYAVFLTVVVGCGGAPEAPPDVSETSARPVPERTGPEDIGREPLTGSRALPDPKTPSAYPEPAFSTSHVLASRELGMTVTGEGTAEPSRSLDILEQQVLSFLPQLQAVYDQERKRDPSLMGSLAVSLTIEPDGQVSDLRFPVSRVSGERLTAAIFDHMRAWIFPPAAEQVRLRYRLLFIPPGIDVASIMTWEKQLDSRAVVDRSKESHPRLAAAPTPAAQPSPPKATAPTPTVKTPPQQVSPPVRVPEIDRDTAVGWYRVERPTSLYAAPRDSSDVVTRLRPGQRVRVIGVVGETWLEVRSVTNRPPGFLRREDAVRDRDERSGQLE